VKGIELSSEKIELAVLEAEGETLIAASLPSVDATGNLMLALRHYRGTEPDGAAIEALAVVEKAFAAL